jgi:hypothetical protein
MLIVQRSTMYKTGVLVYASGLYEIQHTWQTEEMSCDDWLN